MTAALRSALLTPLLLLLTAPTLLAAETLTIPGTGDGVVILKAVGAAFMMQNPGIKVVRREDGDSTLSVLRKSFPGFKTLQLTPEAVTARKTPEAFAIMEASRNAIGFGPYDVAKNAQVKILKIDGRAPTFAGYPSMTTLGLVFKQENLKGTVKKFIDFARSQQANLPIIAAGGIPLD